MQGSSRETLVKQWHMLCANSIYAHSRIQKTHEMIEYCSTEGLNHTTMYLIALYVAQVRQSLILCPAIKHFMYFYSINA